MIYTTYIKNQRDNGKAKASLMAEPGLFYFRNIFLSKFVLYMPLSNLLIEIQIYSKKIVPRRIYKIKESFSDILFHTIIYARISMPLMPFNEPFSLNT